MKRPKQLNCVECGKPIHDTRMRGMCQACYKYFQSGGQIYELPKYGEINYDVDGKPICHICGRSFNKLGAHVYWFHDIIAREYRQRFGLDVKKGVCSPDLKQRLSDQVLAHPNILSGLAANGEAHRFKKGSKGRTKDQVSEQTRKRLAERGSLTICNARKCTTNKNQNNE